MLHTRAALTPPLVLNEPYGSDIVGGVLYVADRDGSTRPDEKGVAVIRRFTMATGLPHVWAAGDCTGEYELTHMSEHMAKQAVTNAILKVPASIDRRGLTWTTFTTPSFSGTSST